MSTAENRTKLLKQIAGVSRNGSKDAQQLKLLCERLLGEQPQSAPLLQRLLARSRRMGKQCAFAPIQESRCSACHMTIASAQIQQARAGAFINCAHCAIFLYHDQHDSHSTRFTQPAKQNQGGLSFRDES